MPNWQTKKGSVKRASYRSGLEESVSKQLKDNDISFNYEPSWGRIDYVVPEKLHFYTPDFYINTRSGKRIIVETKGLWDAKDRKKHLLIKQQYPDLDIRFIFSRSKAKISKASKTTYADICDGKGWGPFKGVTWKYADMVVPDEWLEE